MEIDKNIKPKFITKYTSKTEGYSDGEFEDTLIQLFDSNEPQKKVKEVLDNNPEWPLYYHLTPRRENLLSWYDFNKEASLLEVGSGCGSLTSLFCRKLKSVTAVELTKRRAYITALRNRDMENLTVYAGNLDEVALDEKFDYVTSIGVLEYAGRFIDSNDPFLAFIKKLKEQLKKGGKLILAIENKYGLKYWNGVKEDHTGIYFDSINNYPLDKSVQTFGKKEISDLLKAAGFEKTFFYYPMPDYKTPTEIFSEEYLPTKNHNVRAGLFPVVDHSRDRIYLFNEKMASDNIVLNEKFDFFSNSFLIIAE